MATITTEFGKLSSKKTRTVYLRIRQNGSERRINTLVKVREDEISPKTKKIKNISKAQKVEEMKIELLKTITAIKLDFIGRKDLNANYIVNDNDRTYQIINRHEPLYIRTYWLVAFIIC